MATHCRQKTPQSKWWPELRRILEIEVQVRAGWLIRVAIRAKVGFITGMRKNRVVVIDPEIMSGEPCFTGTRIGHWALVIGHWSLGIGHWALVIGHWSLVIGHWSLVIGHEALFLMTNDC